MSEGLALVRTKYSQAEVQGATVGLFHWRSVSEKTYTGSLTSHAHVLSHFIVACYQKAGYNLAMDKEGCLERTNGINKASSIPSKQGREGPSWTQPWGQR
jgi:hypothetical protein